jgi:DNA-binding transcriptional LysR family regulator
VRRSTIGTLAVDDLRKASFILYPPTSNMRTIIDGFFRECGLSPEVVMEADDTEAIKGLVEAGFGYSILPQRALRAQARHFQAFRVAGHRLARVQALATVRTAYPRALTGAVISLLQKSMAAV